MNVHRGYRGLRALADRHNLRLDIKAPPGFRPIAPLYKVEHAFAQLGRWRRLSRCYEGSEASATAWLQVASVGYLLAGRSSFDRPRHGRSITPGQGGRLVPPTNPRITPARLADLPFRVDPTDLSAGPHGSAAVRIGIGARDVDVLRAGPNADDEELCRLAGGGDLTMHHPAGIEDEIPGHCRHVLVPGGTVFDRHRAAENVDIGIALPMVVPATRESGVLGTLPDAMPDVKKRICADPER